MVQIGWSVKIGPAANTNNKSIDMSTRAYFVLTILYDSFLFIHVYSNETTFH